jgi:hypothetical protein
MSSKKNFFLLTTLLVFITIITRFWNLNWSSGFEFHPDENNMINAVLSLNKNNLSPNFFAYGQFPLYLTYFTTPKHDPPTIQLTLRFWSAFFSVLSIFIFYLIGKKVFKSTKLSLIFSLLIIFTPGLIQLAHFGTTESILIFVFAANIYLSFLFYDHPQNLNLLFFVGLVSGIGIATKISALIFLTSFCFTFLFLFIQEPKKFLNLIPKFSFFILITLIFSVIFSPYNLINFSKFLSSMKYEIGVANGSIPVFYTRQFINSIPYLFQFQKIFPYTNGIFIFIFGFIGFGIIIKKFLQEHKLNPYLLITLFSSLIYFLYQGQLFAKWTRFMSPIFFIAPFLSLFFFKKIKNRLLQSIFIFLAILPGAYFFINTYIYSDTRIQATKWINQNIPISSYVLSEGGNVADIPLYDSKININNFDFYTLDQNQSTKELSNLINKSDYIFIPSRRVFNNQNNPFFPLSQNYYQSLFSGNLRFSLIKTFSKSNSLFLNTENAEETWSVFDNPTIRIFKKNES